MNEFLLFCAGFQLNTVVFTKFQGILKVEGISISKANMFFIMAWKGTKYHKCYSNTFSLSLHMIFIKGMPLNRCDIELIMKENPLKGLKKLPLFI